MEFENHSGSRSASPRLCVNSGARVRLCVLASSALYRGRFCVAPGGAFGHLAFYVDEKRWTWG